MANNYCIDRSNMGRVQGKLVGYLEDHTNVNRRASYATLHLIDASLSKRGYVFWAYVFEDYVLLVLLALCNVFRDYVFVL
jgi:hypothetical protein